MFTKRAGECASLVDSAVIAIHRATPDLVGSEIKAAMNEYGIDSPAILPDLAEFFAHGEGDLWILRLRYRYDRFDRVGDLLTEWRDKGLLVDDRPSERMVGFCRELLRLRARVAAALWDADTAEMVANLAEQAALAAAGPLVTIARRLPQPANVEARCHHALTMMRYGRHDAHVAAWELRLLDGAEAEVLAHGSLDEHEMGRLPVMQVRGLVDEDGAVTDYGRQLVEEIERDTNVWASPMMVAIGDRWAEFRDGVGELAAVQPTDLS